MAFADDNPDLLSLPSREYIKPTEESKKEEAVAKASAEAKKTAGRESKRMGVYSNRIEDISVTKKLEDISVTKKMEDIPKPPIAQPKLKETAEISAEVPFKPPEPGSEADNYFKGVIQKAVEDTAIELAKTFPTSAQAEDIARSTLPRAFDGLGNLPGFGTYMQIGPSGAAMWGEAPESGTSGMDTDKIYIGGIEYTPGANTNDYDFIQIGADGSSSWIAAMISPMPTGYEIYNIRKNHIHISGATAGNI